MGSTNSNLTQSSEVGTLNWDNVKSEENQEYIKKNGFSIKKLDNGFEEIDLDIKPLSDTENSINQLKDVFQKMNEEISKSEENEISKSEEMENVEDSSPFISTELYNKIMQGGSNSLKSSDFNNIKKGGNNHSSSSDSSSSLSIENSSDSSDEKLLQNLSEISVSSSDYPSNLKKKEFKKYNDKESKYHSSSSSKHLKKGYNFSDTSSMISNYRGGNTSESSSLINDYTLEKNSSETSYKLNSESIKTSDINLVSVDSINGRRFLN